MARKRMFDLDIINQDSFFDLPMDAKALYFLLGMEADDEGFVSPKKVLRLYGGTEDSLKVLAAKNYIIPFESGVIVITDWKRNNYLQKDRIKSTIYKDEKAQLMYDKDSQKYIMFNKCLTNVNIEENSIEENSIDKYNIYGEFKNVKLSDEEYKKLKDKNLLDYIEKLSSYMKSKGKRYKSHYATILNWSRKEQKEKTEPNWFNSNIQNETPTEEEQEELDELVNMLNK